MLGDDVLNMFSDGAEALLHQVVIVVFNPFGCRWRRRLHGDLGVVPLLFHRID